MKSHPCPTLPPLAALAALVLGAGAPPPAGAQTVVATVPTAPLAVAAVVNTVTNRIYVLNDDASGQVTVIDGATNSATAVPVGSYPFAIDLNMVTNKVYVANSASNSVTVIDGATNATTTIPVGSNPNSIAVNPTTNRVYVVNNAVDGTISVIDGATDTVVGNIFAGFSPFVVVVDPVANMIFVVAESNNKFTVNDETLYAIDGSTDEMHLVVSPSHPNGMAVNPVTGQLYDSDPSNSGLAVVSYSSGNVRGYREVGAGISYGAVAVNTATDTAYVINDNGNGSLLVVDGTTYATSAVAAGPNPGGVAVDPVTNEIYVTNTTSAGTVTAIDGATGLGTTIPVGTNPGAVAVNPVTNRVYVLNGDPRGTVTVIEGVPALVAPAITSAPQSQTVVAGSPAVFNAGASGRPLPSYQWLLNGVPLMDGDGISGCTGPTLYLGSVTATDAGAYAVTVTNSSGSTTSAAASLSVVSTASPGRIINLSTRAYVASPSAAGGTDVLIAGFAISGQGPEPLVLRGVGPGLAGFGVSGALDRATLSLYDSANPARLITMDTGWEAPPSAPGAPWSGVVAPVDATAADFAQVGAFSLAPGSGDCAVKVSLPAGAYTAQIGSADNGFGIVLAEVYEDQGGPGAQLVNISSRALVSTGAGAMIAGFVISGSSSETVLIRASGPALGEFGLSSTLPDPQLLLYDASKNLVASNTGWGGSPQIASVAALVGAFSWNDPASADSALLVTLAPGSYTAEVMPASGDGGLALVEVYAVP
ncbi:MAG: immunoglobulin domain-containing protein [Opitutaceae bacterium]